MRVLLSTYGARGDVAPNAGLAGPSRALGWEVRVSAPPDSAAVLARVGVPLVRIARFDTVAAAAEECVTPAPARVMPTGGWR